MLLSDGTPLMHMTGAPYDPVKAHEYYLKTRHLKGRRKAGPKIPGTGPLTSKKVQTFTVTNQKGQKVVLTQQQLTEQKAYAAHRVQRIVDKLHRLESELHKRISEAKQKQDKANQPETAAEKHAKAQDAKKFRDKHKTELANKEKQAAATKPKSTQQKQDSVEGLKRTIETVKAKLLKAVEHQRVLTTATKN